MQDEEKTIDVGEADEQEQEIDVAMGDENEARVAAEALEDQSDRSDQAIDADMPSSIDEDLHGQHNDDVEPLAHTGDHDILSNPTASADVKTEHRDGQENTYQPLQLQATVAAEAFEDQNQRSDQATDVDMPKNNADDLHGNQDAKASAAFDSDVEPLA